MMVFEDGPPVRYKLTCPVIRWTGDAAWHFAVLPEEESDELEALYGGLRGWGSIPVQVTAGASTWKTSVFPSKEREAYVLPLKRSIRDAEGINAGDSVDLVVEVRVDELEGFTN